LEAERGPLGPLTLAGTRGGEPLRASLFPDDWGLDVRPDLPAGSATPDARLWALYSMIAASRAPDVEAVRQAAAEAQTLGRPAAAAQIWALCGQTLMDSDRSAQAQACFKEALAVRRSLAPGSLAAAALSAPLGVLAYRSGLEGGEEEKQLAEAQALFERVAPRSLAFARTLNAAGWLSDEGTPAQERRQADRAHDAV